MIENEVLSAAVLCDARLGWWLDIDTIALVDARTRPPVGGGIHVGRTAMTLLAP
jgi:hypothetical protein